MCPRPKPSNRPLATFNCRQLEFNSAFCAQAGFEERCVEYATPSLGETSPGRRHRRG